MRVGKGWGVQWEDPKNELVNRAAKTSRVSASWKVQVGGEKQAVLGTLSGLSGKRFDHKGQENRRLKGRKGRYTFQDKTAESPLSQSQGGRPKEPREKRRVQKEKRYTFYSAKP